MNAQNVLCTQLPCDLFAIAKFLFKTESKPSFGIPQTIEKG